MFEYILREIILSVIAFLAGAGVSAGVFAFVLVIEWCRVYFGAAG